MFKKVLIAAGLATLLVWVVSAQSDLKSVIDKSMKAMGVENVKTLVISGDGGDGAVGQTFNPNSDHWRWFANKNWVRSVDFDAKGWRDVRDRGEGEPANQCGGNGTVCPFATTTGQTAVTMANNFNNQIQFAMLPLGFLKMAQEKNATVSKEKKYTVLTFPMENGTAYKTNVKGYINNQGLVERVETMVDQPMLGDVKWEVAFSNYKDFGGVKFPTSIVQRQGGPKILEMTVADVKVNQPVDLAPAAGRGGKGGPGGPAAAKGGEGKGAPPVFAGGDGKGKGGPGAAKGGPAGPGGGGRGAAAAVESEDLGGGFWLVTGGYGAVVANFKDYIVVIEGPSGDMRADQIIAEAKRLVPGKPIKYVVNTHAHFDHSQGLRDFVAEGATIITHQGNKGYFEKILANPHTLVPDKLQKMSSKPKIKVEYVGEKKVFTDGTHTFETHLVKGSTHNNAMLMIYLPAQKTLIEADEFNVLNPIPTAPVPMPNQYQVNLLANIERLHLDVDRIIPIHLPNPATRKVPLAELKFAAGKS
ncbi:MAG: fold metallo-hydrolase [Bryobacterales bacterium]|jgi:glyoxylase-like metal-dependent hydrolase (beta-lactamase superfamily II)|nr:fold metallo-hydrolase [Bryobacterales bacterium]